MEKDKQGLGIIVGSILKKRDPANDKDESSSGGEKEAIASDLIDAIQAKDTRGVMDALNAWWMAYDTPSEEVDVDSGSSRNSEKDCGCY